MGESHKSRRQEQDRWRVDRTGCRWHQCTALCQQSCRCCRMTPAKKKRTTMVSTKFRTAQNSTEQHKASHLVVDGVATSNVQLAALPVSEKNPRTLLRAGGARCVGVHLLRDATRGASHALRRCRCRCTRAGEGEEHVGAVLSVWASHTRAVDRNRIDGG